MAGKTSGSRYEPAAPPQRDVALSLLLTGQATGQDAAVQQFRSFARQNDLAIDGLWLAWRGDEPIASTLIVPSAGRTGMLFLSPVRGREYVNTSGELAHAACLAQDRTRVRLVQALLDPGQKLEAAALDEARFTDLATLVYMQRRTGDLPFEPLVLGERYTVEKWSEQARPRFAAAILGSYEQTHDCPGLLGLRHIDDIIAGHQATGRFDGDLWYAIHCEDQPVGVMLLNRVTQRQAVELVYLGLCPAFRGKGLARKLMRHALGLATADDAAHMILAVDQANKPAMTLYRSMQFAENAKKIAKIFPLT